MMWRLLAGRAAAREYGVARGQGFLRVVLVHAEQPTLGAAPHEYHAAAGAFALPAFPLQGRESPGKGLAQIGAGRQLGGIEHMVEHVSQDQPPRLSRGGQWIVLAALGGHGSNGIHGRSRRPTSVPGSRGLYGLTKQ